MRQTVEKNRLGVSGSLDSLGAAQGLSGHPEAAMADRPAGGRSHRVAAELLDA